MGAEAFAEHLGAAATALRVSPFALALLLAGAEPEELVTGGTASLRHVPAVALGDVAGANIALCLVALGVGALVAPLPLGPRVRRYGLQGLPSGSWRPCWPGTAGAAGCFATAFELVVRAWSASRRGASETVVAAVVGSFAYNATMTLGGAALARPMRLAAGGHVRGPLLLMDAAMVLVLGLAFNGRLDRRDGPVLLGGHLLFLLMVRWPVGVAIADVPTRPQRTP